MATDSRQVRTWWIALIVVFAMGAGVLQLRSCAAESTPATDVGVGPTGASRGDAERELVRDEGNRVAVAAESGGQPGPLGVPQGSLAIVCQDGEGRSVPGLEIDVREGGDWLLLDARVHRLRTNESGVAHMDARGVDRVVRVLSRDPNWSTSGQAYSVTEATGEVLVLCLRSDVVLRGHVFTLDSHEPIPGAKLDVAGLEVITDTTGSYSLRLAREHAKRVACSAEGFCPADMPLRLESGEAATLDFELKRAVAFDGIVEDEGGLPVAGAIVSCGSRFGVGVTQFDGLFRVFCDVENAVLMVRHENYASCQIRVTEPAEWQRVVLRRGATLRGRITNAAGIGIEGAKVEVSAGLDRRIALTDAGGQYQLAAVRVGMVSWNARAPGFVAHQKTVNVAGPDAVVDEVLSEGSVVAGSVTDGEGRGVAGVVVRVLAAATEREYSPGAYYDPRGSVTGKGGQFVLRDVPSRLAVEVSGRGFATQRLFDQEAIHQPLRVVLQRSSVLHGVVVDADSGEPVPNFVVRLVAADVLQGDAQLSHFPSAWTEHGVSFASPEGRWRLDLDVEPGVVTAVEVRADGYRDERIKRIVVGTDGLTIRMKPK